MGCRQRRVFFSRLRACIAGWLKADRVAVMAVGPIKIAELSCMGQSLQILTAENPTPWSQELRIFTVGKGLYARKTPPASITS